MTEPDFVDALGPALAGALEKRGFTSLTSVQETVLDPALAGRDLRITSQTGSGKTVAIGFALRDLVARQASKMGGIAHPYALVVAPTRELAKQVEEELSWLYDELGARVVSVTGGTSAREERRALAAGPQVVVGTPGRMLDHLDRGVIDASEVGAVVLDEADRLLDLGFREELEAILAHTPEERRTHLVSATFPRDVRSLADAVQRDPAHVEGTRLGEANTDIEHVLHLVDGRDRLNAVFNLLLANPDEQTLLFARTRADVAEIADALAAAGFAASSISGEMDQPQRDRALSAFKRGDLRVLVATDVAARGIDVQDIARVLHAEPPGDADTYTHRSGRTGRAGRKGISSTLVPPSIMAKVVRLLHRAGVKYRFEKIPSAEEIRRAQDDHLIAELTRDADATGTSADGSATDGEKKGAGDGVAALPVDARAMGLAERLANTGDVKRTIARLLMRFRQAGPEPRPVRPIEPPSEVARPSRRNAGVTAAPARARKTGVEPARGTTHRTRAARDDDAAEAAAGGEGQERPAFDSQRPPPSSQRAPRDLSRPWTLFQISWGEAHGADSRRMLAMLCRRGGIESGDVGSIRIGRVASTVEIASDVADGFAESAGKVDMRDPRILIRPASFGAPPPNERGRSDAPPPRAHRRDSAPPRSYRPDFEPRPEGTPPPRSYRPDFEPRRDSTPPPRSYRPDFEPRHDSAPPPRAHRPDFEPRHDSAPPPRAHRPRFQPDAAPPRDEAAPAPRVKGPRSKVKASPKDLPKKAAWAKKTRPSPGGHAPPKRRAK